MNKNNSESSINLKKNNSSKKLFCIYNFLPYASTSGYVMAKRIIKEGKKVDIIHNKIPEKIDESSNQLISDYINTDIFLDTPYALENWNIMKSFIYIGIKKINEITSKNGEYEEIYSRAMFPHGHLLAFEYKMKNPNVKWTAEFSDPLLINIRGKKYFCPVDQEYVNRINTILKEKGINKIEDNNFYFFGEYLPYLFADKIVFINENQRELMLNSFPIKNIKEEVLEKSIISSHPTLDKKYYSIKESKYDKIDKNKVNLAYFGTFFDIRNIYNIFSSLYVLNKKSKDKCLIHLFISNPESYQKIVDCMPIKNNIIVNSYVPYLEFLNLTTKFDCLIVNDSITNQIPGKNPYLPSKLSDYLGSGTDIWGICEKDSSMSKYNLKYKSYIENINTIEETLKKIINDKKNI